MSKFKKVAAAVSAIALLAAAGTAEAQGKKKAPKKVPEPGGPTVPTTNNFLPILGGVGGVVGGIGGVVAAVNTGNNASP